MVSRDRGQLILVGAIAIALILLGLVLIVNTALFTQVVGSEGAVESAKEGGVSAQEIGNAIGYVVAAENRKASPGDSSSTISGNVDVNSSHLDAAFANRTVDSSGSFTSIEYLGPTENGSRVAQETVRNFTDNNGRSSPWDLINSSEAGEVGHFLITIHTDSSSSGKLGVNFTSSTGADKQINLTVGAGGDPVTVDVNGTTCNDVSATNGTVRIDLRNGRVYEDGTCQFDAIESGVAYEVEYRGDTSVVEGTYSIVTSGDVDDNDRDGAPGPVVTDAIWSFEYGFTHDAQDVTVTSDEREVDVYD